MGALVTGFAEGDEVVGFLEGDEVVGFLEGDEVVGFLEGDEVGLKVGFFEGLLVGGLGRLWTHFSLVCPP
jgi:hypothetical protein